MNRASPKPHGSLEGRGGRSSSATIDIWLINCSRTLLNPWRKRSGRQDSKGWFKQALIQEELICIEDNTAKSANCYVWEKPRHCKVPTCHTGAWIDLYLPSLWIAIAMLLTSLIFPLSSESPNVSLLLQQWWLLGYNLQNKQLPKEGCPEPSVGSQVLQLNPNWKIHSAILWTRDQELEAYRYAELPHYFTMHI